MQHTQAHFEDRSRLLLVDLGDPQVMDFSRAEMKARWLVEQDIQPWIEGGATEAQIQRELVHAYRRHFYTPKLVAFWSFREKLGDRLLAFQEQEYQIIFFGEHLQRAPPFIEQWCQNQCPGVAFRLALNDLPSFIEEQNVFLSGIGQKIYEQTPWAYCLMRTLVGLYRASHVLMVTGRVGMERYVEQAKARGDAPGTDIQVVKRLEMLGLPAEKHQGEDSQTGKEGEE